MRKYSLPVLAIIAAVLALAMGMCSGLVNRTSFLMTSVRNTIRNTDPEPVWYKFEHRQSLTASVYGVATDVFEFGLIHRLTEDSSTERPFDIVGELHFGIPFRSHSCTITRQIDGEVFVLGGSALAVGDRLLPLNIRPVGLILNWVLLFASLALPYLAYGRKIRRTRELNCRCVACGYDISHSAVCCPECGHALPSRPGAIDNHSHTPDTDEPPDGSSVS